MADTYITNHTELGDVSISEDVLISIVTAAVAEIKGVSGFSGALGTDISELLGKGKNSLRGVKITSENGTVFVNLLIMVRYGCGVTVVAKKVQEAVCESVEGMTGLNTKVNVHVTGIAFDKTDLKG